MRFVVELTQREADDLMLWDGKLAPAHTDPFGDVEDYAIPDEILAALSVLRDAIVKAEAFAKAHP